MCIKGAKFSSSEIVLQHRIKGKPGIIFARRSKEVRINIGNTIDLVGTSKCIT